MTKSAKLILVVLLTLVKPRVSLYLFIVISPLVSVYQDLSFDPRILWAACLAARAAFPFDGDRLWSSWRIIGSAVGFAVYVEVVFLLNSRGMPPDDLSGAQNALFFVISGGLFVFAVSRLIDTEAEAVKAVMSLAVAGCYVSLYAIWQSYGANGEGQAIRPGSTLINPNVMSTYMSLTCVCLTVAWRLVDGRWRRAFIGLVIGLSIVSVGLSLSRAGLVALLLGLLLWWSTRDQRLSLRKAVTVGLLCCSLIFLVLTYLRIYRIQIASEAVDERTQLLTEVSQSFDDYSRYQAALYAVSQWMEHPIIGIGFGTFPTRNYQANGFYVTTHNTLLEILVGTGIVGLATFAYISAQFWRGLNRSGKFLFIPIAVCLAVTCLFGDLLQEIAIVEVVALGYLTCIYQGRTAEAPTVDAQ